MIAIEEDLPVRELNSILVYRGASESNAPIKIAGRIASAGGAHVTLGDTIGNVTDANGNKLKELNKIAARMRRSGVEASSVLLQGEPADAVIECIVHDRHDLLIMNAMLAGVPGVDRETTIRVVRQSPVPVLLARDLRRRKVLRILAAVDASGWDSQDSDNLNARLIDRALWLAERLEGSVQVLHVWQPVGEGPMRWAGASPEAMTEYHDTGRDHVAKELEATVGRSRISADRVHVEIGDPRSIIPQFAADKGIDLIVIGTFARSGIPERILGNSADAILDSSPCSMLVVPRVKS